MSSTHGFTGTTDSTSLNNESTLLSRLPAELRNETYELALTQPTPVMLPVTRGSQTCHINNQGVLPKPPLLAVCKQIRAEAMPVFYSSNVFFCSTNAENTYVAPLAFLHSSDVQERKALKRLEVCLEIDMTTSRAIWGTGGKKFDKAIDELKANPSAGSSPQKIIVQWGLEQEPCLIRVCEAIRWLPIGARRSLVFTYRKDIKDIEDQDTINYDERWRWMGEQEIASALHVLLRRHRL